MEQIKYREGYKYQLAEDYVITTDILGYEIDIQFIKLDKDGKLTTRSGYAWDGASGPTLDTPDSMRGSLVHDVLYQLMRMGLLPQSLRAYADKLLEDICIEDGMPEFRADYWHFAVDNFAASAADPENQRKVLTAP